MVSPQYLIKAILFFGFLFFFVQLSDAQSRSGIGIGLGVNQPFSSDYNLGGSIQLQGNIAIGSKLGIVPDIGYDRINSKGGFMHVPNGLSSNKIDDIDLFHLGLSLRYFFDRHWFAGAGGMFYMAQGKEDTDGIGAGGFGGVGYNLDIDEHNTLAFSLNTSIVDIVYNGNGVTPIAGLKVAYVVNFKGNR